jgi:serine/threonine protein kinase
VGQIIGAGRFELKKLLGTGGMGEVYLAEHQYTGQNVAIKAVWPNLMAEQNARARFLQEGRTLGGLKHPNIVGLQDFFEEGGRFFLVMEYIEGVTLDAMLRHKREKGGLLETNGIVRILTGVLEALAHAHGQTPAVVHRDIKPSNVMLGKDGRAVLMDFGIAKVVGGEKLTRTRGVVGTYEYMSPEQVQGGEIAPATDVYAVGIMAFEMLTGLVPFPQKTDSGMEAMKGHVELPVPDVRSLRPDCPQWLANLVARALAKRPQERYANAGEMLSALKSGGPVGSASGRTEAPNSVDGSYRTPVSSTSLVARTPVPSESAPGSTKTPGGTAATAEPQVPQPVGMSVAPGEVPPVAPAVGVATARWFLVMVCLALAGLIGLAGYMGRQQAEPATPSRDGYSREAYEARVEAEKAGKTDAQELEAEDRSAGRSGLRGITWFRSVPAGLDFARTETTVAQYRDCVNSGKCESGHHRTMLDHSFCNWGYSDRDNHPMNCVDWYGADAFCKAVGGRLPTEDEWYAEASGGRRREYPWGDSEVSCDLAIWGADSNTDWGDGSNTAGCGENRTWPVCSEQAGNSVSGLCDMSGNVWEWTSTGNESARVVRGGSWLSHDPGFLRSSARGRNSPSLRDEGYGFRCVLSFRESRNEVLKATGGSKRTNRVLSACERYASCCYAHADALGKVERVLPWVVEATKQGCERIEGMKAMGSGADQACTGALDAMKQAMAAYTQMPGFDWPEACR